MTKKTETTDLYVGENFKRVTVGGVEYVLQKLPFEEYLDIVNQATKGMDLNRKAWAKAMYANVVVEPQVTMEDFDYDIQSGLELVGECERFLMERG